MVNIQPDWIFKKEMLIHSIDNEIQHVFGFDFQQLPSVIRAQPLCDESCSPLVRDEPVANPTVAL